MPGLLHGHDRQNKEKIKYCIKKLEEDKLDTQLSFPVPGARLQAADNGDVNARSLCVC